MEVYFNIFEEYEADYLKNEANPFPLSLRSLVVTWLNFLNILVEESPFINRKGAESIASSQSSLHKKYSSRLDSVLNSLFGSSSPTKGLNTP